MQRHGGEGGKGRKGRSRGREWFNIMRGCVHSQGEDCVQP